MKSLSNLVCVTLFVAPLFAGDEVLTVTPADARRHMYAEFRNDYNNSYLHVVVGELMLCRGRLRTPLPIDFARDRNESCGGFRDIDTLEMNRFTTPYFIPREGDVLTMFRQVYVQPKHSQSTDEVPHVSFGPYPNNWQSIAGDVVDTTTVIVRIERVADTTDFVDIDSVVMYPNPNSAFVAHAGTDPELYEHTRAIPQQYVGQSVRIRTVAKRRGYRQSQFTSGYMIGVPAFSAWRCPWAMSKIDTSEIAGLYARQAVLETAFAEMCKGLPTYVSDVTHEQPSDVFAISSVRSFMRAGGIDVDVKVPNPVDELAWYVYDVTGTLLNSGLVWRRIESHGWVYLPFIPYTQDAFVVKIEDTATGFSDIREIQVR